MRIFKSTSNYVIAFFAYGMSALLSFHRSPQKSLSVPRADAFICFSQVVVSFCVALLFISLMRRTTYGIEKAALALTGVYFIFYSLSTLQTFGYLPPLFSSTHPIFVIITCLSAIVAGVRMVQVLSNQRNEISPK
jgi:hypothetical protein